MLSESWVVVTGARLRLRRGGDCELADECVSGANLPRADGSTWRLGDFLAVRSDRRGWHCVGALCSC